MRVAVVQSDIVWEDPQSNYVALRPWLSAAAAADARLVVLPEMFATGFSMRTERTAERAGGPTTAFLRDSARQHGFWLAGSVALRSDEDGRPRNSLLLAGPEGELHRYDKIHASAFGGEQDHFGCGRTFTTVDVEGVRVTLFVCYDLRFADEFWATAESTDCYLVVASWPTTRLAHWTTLLTARAIENQAYVVGSNRVGVGGGDDFSGGSMVVGPWGEILATAHGGPTMLLADVDPQQVRELRQRLPVLAERRYPAPQVAP
ncbi:MAG TPA: nitrilase-related carbon-nitrogen hydrolase [Actinomycetales bacterium]|nr:nitrilase-related carbon-nitrogen hydrolase [Actinomycetales bacterium]